MVHVSQSIELRLIKASTYQQVHRVLRLLNVNMGLLDDDIVRHSRKARKAPNGLERGKVTYERTRRNQDVFMPELSIVGAWVVVMKLAYGLDGKDRYVVLSGRIRAHGRYALDPSDQVLSMPDISKWVKELERRLRNGDLKGGKKDMEKQ